MKRKTIFYILTCFFATTVFFYNSCYSQNTNSPYSVYGIGDIDYKMYNRTSGLAGTGLALPSTAYLINNNPAAIAGLTRSFYIFNVAGAGKTVQFSGTPVTADNSTSKDFWIKGISLSVKINKFWASSFGFNQFSNINYKFSGDKQVEGSTSQYLISYEGDGGLNDYYWTNAFSIGKHFMAGIKSSFMAGGINQSEIISDEALSATIQTTQQDYYYHLKFEYGGIYYTALNKNWDFSLGGKFSTKTNMPSNRTLTAIENGTTIVSDQYISSNNFFLPATAGLGIALTHNKKSMLVADYVFENWSPLRIGGNGWQLINNNRISAGYELSRQENRLGRMYAKNSLQFGAYYNTGYLSIRNTQINNFGATIGTAGYLGQLLYNLSLDVGQRGTRQNNLIRENYFQLTLGISYRDFLFSKGRKYD
ncbi:MAG: hypothetical protein ACHQEB_00500 [Chitinophagales bacterium]